MSKNLVGVIKHELVHYTIIFKACHTNIRTVIFKLVQRIAGLRYAPATSKAKVRKQPKHYWIYTCKNGHEIYRQRRLNELRYACGKCGAIRLTGELKLVTKVGCFVILITYSKLEVSIHGELPFLRAN